MPVPIPLVGSREGSSPPRTMPPIDSQTLPSASAPATTHESESQSASGSARLPRWTPYALCSVLYLAVSWLMVGHITWLGADHAVGRWSPDVIEQVWWLQWTEFAILHGHNLFQAQWQNVPLGQNFGVNGSMLALGTVMTPLTRAFGAVVSWNLLVRLAPALSALSLCLVLRRRVRWWPAAFVGGLLYGFSAYLVHFSGGLLFLTFAPLPPIFFLLLYEGSVRQRWTPQRTGVLIGLVCALQFFLWSEYLVSMVTIGGLAGVLVVATPLRRRLGSLRATATTGAIGILTACVFLVPAAVYTLFGPQSTGGSPAGALGSDRFPNDLVASVVPSSQWLTTPGIQAHAAAHFEFAVASYVGIPLLAVLAVFVVLFRRNRALVFCVAMMAISFVLALGPHLVVDGHRTPIWLPFGVFIHVPLLDGFVALRFSLYTDLFGAAAFALGMVEMRHRILRRHRRNPAADAPRGSDRRRVMAAAMPLALAVVVLLPLLPGQARPESATATPSFFISDQLARIPNGGVVLAYPYPDYSGPSIFYQTSDRFMGYQVASGMRFKLLGGYGWFPSPTDGHGIAAPARPEPADVQKFFDDAFYNYTSDVSRQSVTSPHLTRDLRTFLRVHDVEAVLVQSSGADPLRVVQAVAATIGCPVTSGGITAWFDVPARLTRGDAAWGPCGLSPQVDLSIVRPRPSTTVSATVVLDTAVAGYVSAESVTYEVSGTGSGSRPVSGSLFTPVGWIGRWNTTTVPNGTYTLRCVAVDSLGRITTSRGVSVTVRNPGPGP